MHWDYSQNCQGYTSSDAEAVNLLIYR